MGKLGLGRAAVALPQQTTTSAWSMPRGSHTIAGGHAAVNDGAVRASCRVPKSADESCARLREARIERVMPICFGETPSRLCCWHPTTLGHRRRRHHLRIADRGDPAMALEGCACADHFARRTADRKPLPVRDLFEASRSSTPCSIATRFSGCLADADGGMAIARFAVFLCSDDASKSWSIASAGTSGRGQQVTRSVRG